VSRHVTAVALVTACVLASAGVARAQQAAQPAPPAAAPAPAPAPPREPTLLKVLVVISRYQGEKKLSSQPYTLSVRADGVAANLRMGMQVAIPNSGPDGKSQVMYKDVGTAIDCAARTLEGGRFQLELTIDDSSLAVDGEIPTPFAKGIPQFRSFRIQRETAFLRDGQTTQLTTAAEKVTGEVAKVDVTLTVVK
jgi:hypothetical protein